MTESSKKMEDIYEEFTNQVDRINYLIKQVVVLFIHFYFPFVRNKVEFINN